MLKIVKESVHRMISRLQLISSYLEVKDYTRRRRVSAGFLPAFWSPFSKQLPLTGHFAH